MMHKPTILGLLSVVTLSACSAIPPQAYYDRGNPESLLDVSSEVVNLSIENDQMLDELAQWINQDQPSRAELYCQEDDARCTAAQEVLDLYGVPSMYVPATDNNVTLVYERVLARDCENRFIDSFHNPYHLNQPTLGCSISVNMVQMVSDKKQFVRPDLMDMPDAVKGVQVFRNYREAPPSPSEIRQTNGSTSLLEEGAVE